MKKPPKGATVKKNCECCDAKFIARLADHRRGWARYCSKSCKAKKQPRPMRAEPIDMTKKEDHRG